MSLTPAQWNMYIMDHSVPHIPLAKHTSDSWEDLSPVMKSCKRAAERKETSDGSIIFPPTLQCNSKKGDIFCAHTKNSKYDVKLVKDCENVVITPKSDFKPCKAQYSLKQKAIDSIPPFFESLKAAGGIVPCNDSPICTPLFPVKKSDAKINQQNGVLFRIFKQVMPSVFQVNREANSGLLSTSIGGATHAHVCANPTICIEALRQS